MHLVGGNLDPPEADVVVRPVVGHNEQCRRNRRIGTQADGDRLRQIGITPPSVVSDRQGDGAWPAEIVAEPYCNESRLDRRKAARQRLQPLWRGNEDPTRAGSSFQRTQGGTRRRFIAIEQPCSSPLLIRTRQHDRAAGNRADHRAEENRAPDVGARQTVPEPWSAQGALCQQSECTPGQELQIVKVSLVELDCRGASESHHDEDDEPRRTWMDRADEERRGGKRKESNVRDPPESSGAKPVHLNGEFG